MPKRCSLSSEIRWCHLFYYATSGTCSNMRLFISNIIIGVCMFWPVYSKMKYLIRQPLLWYIKLIFSILVHLAVCFKSMTYNLFFFSKTQKFVAIFLLSSISLSFSTFWKSEIAVWKDNELYVIPYKSICGNLTSAQKTNFRRPIFCIKIAETCRHSDVIFDQLMVVTNFSFAHWV